MKLREMPSLVSGCSAYRTENNLAIICGQEPCGPGGTMRWHLSISHARRYPTWDEIRDIRYALVPDEVMVAMFLPPRAQYINVHSFCFHLYAVEAEDVPVNIIREMFEK